MNLQDLALTKIKESQLFGGDTVGESAKIFNDVLSLKGTKEQENVVLANASLAIQCFNADKALADCISEARESLSSGAAYQGFKSIL